MVYKELKTDSISSYNDLRDNKEAKIRTRKSLSKFI